MEKERRSDAGRGNGIVIYSEEAERPANRRSEAADPIVALLK